MKKLQILSPIFLFFFAFSLSSCSGDEDVQPEDIRDQLVGTYTYVLKHKDLVDGYIDEYTGTIKIEKARTSADIIFFEDGEVVAVGAKVQEASNGIAFDIEDGSVTEDGVFVEEKGEEIFELNGSKYHGGYEKSTNKIYFFISTYYDGQREGFSAYELTKI